MSESVFESSFGRTFWKEVLFSHLIFLFLQAASCPLKFLFNREQAVGSYIQAPCNEVDSSNEIPISYVSLELHLLSLLPKES